MMRSIPKSVARLATDLLDAVAKRTVSRLNSSVYFLRVRIPASYTHFAIICVRRNGGSPLRTTPRSLSPCASPQTLQPVLKRKRGSPDAEPSREDSRGRYISDNKRPLSPLRIGCRHFGHSCWH